MRLFSLVLLLFLLQPVWADPPETHRALFEVYCPPSLHSEELAELAWPSLQKAIPSPLWERLEPLSELSLKERERELARLSQSEATAGLHLFLRRSYLGWLYGGDRGREWAGLPPRQSLEGEAEFPKLPKSFLALDGRRVKHRDGAIDYLIVGSGPAGSVLGHELSRAGYRVLLLEQGSLVLPGVVDTRTVPELKVGGGAVPTLDHSILVRHGMTVGGGSTVNVDLAFSPTLPFVQEKIRSWRDQGLIGRDQWTHQDVERAYGWVQETIGTRTPDESEINANNRVLWEGAKACGLDPQLYQLNTLPGRPPHLNKCSSVNTLLLKAMSAETNSLQLLPDAAVRKLLVEGDRVLGVSFEKRPSWEHRAVLQDPAGLKLETGASYQVRAKRVILCAGSLGSAGLLLRSGVGGEKVGQGVVLHPSMPLIGRFQKEIDATQGEASTVYVVDQEDSQGILYECMSGEPNYVAMMLFGSAPQIAERLRGYKQLAGFGVLLVDSVSPGNQIVLDQDGEPQVSYSLTPQDKSRFRRGLSQAVQMMLAAGADEVYLPSCEFGQKGTWTGELAPFRSEQDLEAIESIDFLPARTVVTSAHMQSTCKMGSVVNTDHRVFGYQNLYICDSSVFPGSVGANPMQTIYTVAKLFSEELLREQQLRKKP